MLLQRIDRRIVAKNVVAQRRSQHGLAHGGGGLGDGIAAKVRHERLQESTIGLTQNGSSKVL